MCQFWEGWAIQKYKMKKSRFLWWLLHGVPSTNKSHHQIKLKMSRHVLESLRVEVVMSWLGHIYGMFRSCPLNITSLWVYIHEVTYLQIHQCESGKTNIFHVIATFMGKSCMIGETDNNPWQLAVIPFDLLPSCFKDFL